MAVPFRKVSKTSKNTRRAHDALKSPTTTKCSNCGEVIKPHRVCDKLGISLYLYRSSDGVSYENYRDWTFEKSNGSYFWKVLEVIVPSGYYYAIAGSHTATFNGEGEMTTTYAEGLWVN